MWERRQGKQSYEERRLIEAVRSACPWLSYLNEGRQERGTEIRVFKKILERWGIIVVTGKTKISRGQKTVWAGASIHQAQLYALPLLSVPPVMIEFILLWTLYIPLPVCKPSLDILAVQLSLSVRPLLWVLHFYNIIRIQRTHQERGGRRTSSIQPLLYDSLVD